MVGSFNRFPASNMGSSFLAPEPNQFASIVPCLLFQALTDPMNSIGSLMIHMRLMNLKSALHASSGYLSKKTVCLRSQNLIELITLRIES